jgi:segregation and condensation protein A
LSELIEQLQQMATQLLETPTRSRTLRPRPQSRTQAELAIAHLAHDENLTEVALQLEAFIERYWHKLSAGKDWLNLEQLLEWWTLSPDALERDDVLEERSDWCDTAIDTTEPTASDRVGIFWALLLLSAQSKVELSQEEFYQDLKIRALT